MGGEENRRLPGESAAGDTTLRLVEAGEEWPSLLAEGTGDVTSDVCRVVGGRDTAAEESPRGREREKGEERGRRWGGLILPAITKALMRRKMAHVMYFSCASLRAPRDPFLYRLDRPTARLIARG